MNNLLKNVYKCKGSSYIVLLPKDRGVFLKRTDVLPQTLRRFVPNALMFSEAGNYV